MLQTISNHSDRDPKPLHQQYNPDTQQHLEKYGNTNNDGARSNQTGIDSMVVNLEDGETLDYLNEQRDSNETQKDWWHDLTEEQKSGIARGLKDVDEGRVRSHYDIKMAYVL
jgi:hypothetical protein